MTDPDRASGHVSLIVTMHSRERSSKSTHPLSFPAAKLATIWVLDDELEIYTGI